MQGVFPSQNSPVTCLMVATKMPGKKKLLPNDLPEPGLVEDVFDLAPQVNVLQTGDETPGIIADWSHCSSWGIRWC